MSKGKELLKSLDYIDDKYLDLVEEMTVKKNRIWWKSGVAVAACVVLVLASGTAVAYATNLFGLKDVIIRTEPKEEELPDEPFIPTSEVELPDGSKILYNEIGDSTMIPPEGTTEEEIPIPTSTGDINETISLNGFAGTPEANASAEWDEYYWNYVDTHELTNDPVEPDAFGEDLKCYCPYNQEMADKMREIVAKYNLKLHTEPMSVLFEDFDAYFGGRLCPDSLSECYGAHGYTDGTISFDAGFVDEDGYQFDIQFDCHEKGYFDDVCLTIGNSEDYIQENYVTKNGTEVSLSLSPYKGLIIVNYDNKFIVVNMLLNMYEKYENDDWTRGEFTMDKMKAFADEWNFELLNK